MKLINIFLACIITSAIIIILVPMKLSALNTENIVAYPVPFNPKKGGVRFITVGNAPGFPPLSIDKISLEIFDINGDFVAKITDTASTAKWNGRNGKGLLVKPGLYIIKVTVEDSTTGDFGRKMIRVLVQY